MKLWVVGKNIDEVDSGVVWELQGVFSTKEFAIQACVAKEYFYGPVELNENLPDKSVDWKGCIYPWYKNDE